MKIQRLFLKRTFSKILETDDTSGHLEGLFQWDSIPHMWESNPSSSLYLRNSSLSEFGWRQSSSPLEMEKTNAHCHGCQPHPCSNNEALDLNSKGGAKITGSIDFFFFNFNFIECRKKKLQWFHQQQQHQFAGTATTEAQKQHPGPRHSSASILSGGSHIPRWQHVPLCSVS